MFNQIFPKFLKLLAVPRTGEADVRVVYVDCNPLNTDQERLLHRSLSAIPGFDFSPTYVDIIAKYIIQLPTDLFNKCRMELNSMILSSVRSYWTADQHKVKETKELRAFLKANSLIIKPSDKGGRTVVMSEEFYKSSCLRLLQNELDYRVTTKEAYEKSLKAARNLVTRHIDILRDSLGPRLVKEKTKEFRIGYFYGLPKVHKSLSSPPMRPVVSQVNHPTAIFSYAINSFLLRWVMQEPSISASNHDFLNKIKALTIRSDCYLITIDVASLYTSIPLSEGIQRLLDYAEAHCCTKFDFSMLHLAKKTLPFAQYNNFFLFDSIYYRQRKGVAMGSPLGPTFANIYMLDLDRMIMENTKCMFYNRYIDDIFMICDDSSICRDRILPTLNSLDTNIRFTIERVGHNVNFLDLDLFIRNGKVEHQLYEKSISCTKRYIEVDSLHPPSTRKGIPIGVMKRIIALTPNALTRHILFDSIFYDRLKRIGYDNDIMKELWWDLITKRVTKDSPRKVSGPKVRVVTPYDPSWKENKLHMGRINGWLRSNRKRELEITFSCHRSTKSYLVRSSYNDNKGP